MIYHYDVVTEQGEKQKGTIDAANQDLAIASLQRRGFVVISIKAEDGRGKGLSFTVFEHVPMKDIVILSRQIATLFDAQVSALKAFSLLASNAENNLLRFTLTQIGDDLQSGVSISGALERHPEIFSSFYVSMVRAGEESGKLNDTFRYLADYLDRQYALTSKTRNALVYPAFVIFTFIVVMILMFVMVIPKLSQIIIESGQEVPLYTKIVIGVSDLVVNYGIFILLFFAIAGIYLWTLSRRESGKMYIDRVKLGIPAAGNLFKKLYLSRIADNMDTMLSSGISIVRAIDITSDVVGNRVYKAVMKDAMEQVKAGSSLSGALEKHPEMPPIMIQMVKVGEETGSLGSILKTLAVFYKREVDDAVDTLVGLIEPIMIVALGLGVGVLLTSILVPIYNIAGGIQ